MPRGSVAISDDEEGLEQVVGAINGKIKSKLDQKNKRQ